MRRRLLPICIGLILPQPIQAATYLVNPDGSGDFPTIQAALDAIDDGDSQISIIGCTFYRNAAPMGSAISLIDYGGYAIERSIIANGHGGQAINGLGVISCTNIHGNEGGDWIGGAAEWQGTNGNISADPLFCKPEDEDLHLQEDSPCAPFSPPNAGCDLIGALVVDCGTPIERTSWSSAKALFGRE
jgi:hypothetical protein